MPRKKTPEEIRALISESTLKGLSYAFQYLAYENEITVTEDEALEYAYETAEAAFDPIRGFKNLLFPNLEQLDGISKLCQFWKPYVHSASFGQLLLHCFKRMCLIHSCTIYARNFQFNNFKKVSSCISNIVPLVNEPPETLSTFLNTFGEVKEFNK